MEPVVLDTDVASLSLKHRLPPTLVTRLIGKSPCITFVTLGELTQWVELRHWGPRNRALLEQWLNGVAVLPHSDDVSRTWGQISARATQRGRPRPANDTWIAACCLVYRLPLATLNVKDFVDYASHEGLTIVTR